MKQFAVFGNPIAHSKSPEIHVAFAAQFGIDLNYERILAEEGKFSAYAMQFFERGAGANVTIPFKEEALRFADELSETAQIAGAVNTLSRQNGIIKGDNTDGFGLVKDIRDNFFVPFEGKSVLIIGAGGAAKGVLYPIANEQPRHISIVNRTPEKAHALAEQFAHYVTVHAYDFATLNDLKTPFDIVINATSSGLSNAELPLSANLFSHDTLAYDMMYGKEPTAFMQFARDADAVALDGLGMLVEQAAKSFELWHGVMPETQGVIKAIRESLSLPD